MERHGFARCNPAFSAIRAAGAPLNGPQQRIKPSLNQTPRPDVKQPRRNFRHAAEPRKHYGRRVFALAAAIAVPAMAAPAEWRILPSFEAEAQAAELVPMGFETPGESFPGSAFYYLASDPYLPLDSQSPAEASELVETKSAGALAEIGPAARARIYGGTGTDKARALQCLSMAVYYEAASEADAGQRAVAQVVLNRVAHPSYPNTVCGVVFQGSERETGCQFTFTCDGSLDRKPARVFWDRAQKVAMSALAGAVYRPAGLATHYHTLQVHPYWADSLSPIGTIGAHQFYRWPGTAGQPSAFVAAYRGQEPLPAPRPRSAASSGMSADPIELAREFERTHSSTATASAPFPPAQAPAAAAAQPVVSGKPGAAIANQLPTSGQVREEYANSGQWIAGARPGRQ